MHALYGLVVACRFAGTAIRAAIVYVVRAIVFRLDGRNRACLRAIAYSLALILINLIHSPSDSPVQAKDGQLTTQM
jgi:hypothetical protein